MPKTKAAIKVVAMFKIIFLAFFTTLLFGNNFIPNEQCSYESDKFWIKILYLCVESDVGCEKMQNCQ